jgi:uncharacterized membrane protein HdeD (DUF308 family)
MITTGSKYLYGLGFALLVAADLYAWGSGGGLNGALTLGLMGGVGEPGGFFVLVVAAAAALFLAGVVTAVRDADAEAVQAYGRFATVPEVPPASGASYWPIVAAFGLAAAALGLVIGVAMFVLGLALMAVAALEWTVRAWSDRATGDPEANRRIRNRLMHPFEVPLTGALGIAAGVLALSRVLLATSETASWIIALVLAAAVLAVASIIAVRPRLNRSVVAAVCLLGAVAVLGGGIIAASHGEREFEKHTTEHDSGEAPADAGAH